MSRKREFGVKRGYYLVPDGDMNDYGNIGYSDQYLVGGGKGVKIAQDSMNFLKQRGINIMSNVYSITRENPRTETKSVTRYDYPISDFGYPVLPADIDFAKFALAWYVCGLVPRHVMYELSDVIDEFVVESSPGYPFKEMGFNARGEMLIAENFERYIRPVIGEIMSGEYVQRIWQSFVKVEMLAQKKINESNERTITSPPTDLYFCQVMACGAFNKCLKRSQKYCLNFTPFYGGMEKIASDWPDGWIVSESDAKQYDSSIPKVIHEFIWQLRRDRLLEMCEDDVDRYDNMFRNLRKEEIETIVALPSGQTLKKGHGMPSGSYCTSSNNTMIRHFYNLAAWFSLCGPWRDFEHAYREYENNVRDYYLGDDELLYIHSVYAERFSVEKRAHYLAGLGVRLKVETPDSHTPVGHHFLGWTFVSTNKGVQFGFDSRKALYALCYPESNAQKLDFQIVRVCALAMLLRYEFAIPIELSGSKYVKVYDVLLDYYNDLVERGVPVPEGLSFPSIGFLDSMWSGLERREPDSLLPGILLKELTGLITHC